MTNKWLARLVAVVGVSLMLAPIIITGCNNKVEASAGEQLYRIKVPEHMATRGTIEYYYDYGHLKKIVVKETNGRSFTVLEPRNIVITEIN